MLYTETILNSKYKRFRTMMHISAEWYIWTCVFLWSFSKPRLYCVIWTRLFFENAKYSHNMLSVQNHWLVVNMDPVFFVWSIRTLNWNPFTWPISGELKSREQWKCRLKRFWKCSCAVAWWVDKHRGGKSKKKLLFGAPFSRENFCYN